MSADDHQPNLPETDSLPGDGSEDLLASLTPTPLELKPIQGARKVVKSREEEDDLHDSPGNKRKKKLHAPDPKSRPALPELPLTDEPGIGDLPELPAIRPELVAPDRETLVELEELIAGSDAGNPAPAGDEPATPAGEEAGDAGIDAGAASSTPPTAPKTEVPVTDRPPGLLTTPDAGERKWLGLLLAGLLVIGGVFYFLLRSALPSDSGSQARLKPNLPIKGEKVTIEALDMDWKDEGSDSLAGGLKASTLFPRVSMRFAPGGSGAVRIFFRNEREQLVGDSVDLEPGGGSAEHVVTCTAGLRSRLEYDVLRTQDAARWTLEIHEGPKVGAPLSEFTLLSRLAIPWNLERQSSP
jgi:hypothetical protein